jgi:spore germination cell wall hydrolase CwlJ-like protein
MTSNEIDILARTIYGEARGEYGGEGGLASLIAVGNVVMNRLRAKRGYGKTIGEVCQKPQQFSCWNHRDPNYVLLRQEEISDPIFSVCYNVATKVAHGEWPDLTKGSDHYHATYLHPIPAWAREVTPKVRIAQHIFYQLRKGE